MHQQLSALAEAIPTRFSDDPGLPFWLLTIRCGIRVTQAFVEWCDEAEAALARQAGVE